MDLLQTGQQLASLRSRYDLACQQVKTERRELAAAQERLEQILTAQKLVQEVAEQVQTRAHQQIASVVTRCLKAVFGDDAYEFKIRFSQKRGRTEAQLLFVRDGLEIEPTEAAGGGVIDVAAFALRLACLVLIRPQKRKLLVLDEPFRFLSQEFRPAVRELLETLARETGIQMIVVTHIPELQIGKVIELG
jgi:DNA repair exonuclease SbcCD ATPase subunit